MLTLPAVSVSFAEMGQRLSFADWHFTCDLQVEYASKENASMVYTTLSVDKELQPDKVKRNMVSNGRTTTPAPNNPHSLNDAYTA